MTKTVSRITAVLLLMITALVLPSCSKGTANEASGEEDTSEPGMQSAQICAYFTDADGSPLANARLIGYNSGEEFTYTTDYMGYAELSGLPVGEPIQLYLQDENGENTASVILTIRYGDDYAFEQKDREKQTLTIPQDTAVIFASFTLTESRHFICTSLS